MGGGPGAPQHVMVEIVSIVLLHIVTPFMETCDKYVDMVWTLSTNMMVLKGIFVVQNKIFKFGYNSYSQAPLMHSEPLLLNGKYEVQMQDSCIGSANIMTATIISIM